MQGYYLTAYAGEICLSKIPSPSNNGRSVLDNFFEIIILMSTISLRGTDLSLLLLTPLKIMDTVQITNPLDRKPTRWKGTSLLLVGRDHH